jgi:hypothetical protein
MLCYLFLHFHVALATGVLFFRIELLLFPFFYFTIFFVFCLVGTLPNRLGVLERKYKQERYSMQDKITKTYPNTITNAENNIEKLKNDIHLRSQSDGKDFIMKLNDTDYFEKKEAGEWLIMAVRSEKFAGTSIGEYKGFQIVPRPVNSLFDSSALQIDLIGSTNHFVELSDSGSGNITRIDNTLNSIATKINDEQETLAMTRANLETIKAQINKPFDKADESRSMKKELGSVATT